MKTTLRGMVLAVVMVFVAGSASALVINFDFQAWPGATPPSVTYSGQGALADPGNNHWNSGGNGWGAYSTTNLKASDGTVTPVDFAVTGCKNYNWFEVGNALMGDYKYIDGGYSPATMTFSDLTANTPYRFYLYAAGDAANKGSKFTFNGVTKETTGTVSSQFIKDGNYVILDTVSNASGQVIITWAVRAGTSQAALNGFQITDVVPHPTDLNDSGKVDMKDFAILSQGWRDGYEIAELRMMVQDWLLITDVAFQSDHIVEMDAVEGTAYSSNLSDDLVAFDASQLTFSKLTGPGWLTVAADGTLGGTPSASDVGLSVFTVRVEDDFGNSDQASVNIAVNGQGWVAVYPQEYPGALRNPLMGFRPNTNSSGYQEPYATVTRCYIRWNELENDESDTIDKIKTVCNTKWKDAEKYNVKVIPRVYLDWDGNPGNEYWPADMDPNDYTSDQFKTRLRRLIGRLGQCWDTDPRVAWVQMGIIGYWGEHHSPSPTAEIQQLMGEEFTAAFPNKKILVRYPWVHFTNFEFGGYWDRWADSGETTAFAQIPTLNTTQARWKVNVWEGECGYGSPYRYVQPGDNPDDTLSDPAHRNFLIDTIRNLHCSGLGWISGYTKTNPAVVAGAEEVQRAFGYRYLLNEVKYPAMLTSGAAFSMQFKVTNVGSAPFYYNWPVEVSLLNATTKAVVWKANFAGSDIRNWLPGDQYNSTTRTYSVPAVANIVTGTFQLPATGIANGEYILALAILDPAGMLPSARFSTINYFNGGRHPIGKIGVGLTPSQIQLSPSVFNDIATDRSLYYVK